MRIEINKGGLFSGTSVKDFAGEYDDLMEEQRNVIEAFKAVRSKVADINGGPGVLSSAMDKLEERITKTDEALQQKTENAARHFSHFLTQVKRQDNQVARVLGLRYKDYVKKYSSLSKERSTWSKICIFFDTHLGGSFKRGWMATKRWCSKHKVALIKAGIALAIAVAAVITVVTAGAGTPLLLLLAAKGALIMGTVGMGVSVGVGLYAGHRGGQLFDDAMDGVLSGQITGIAWGVGAGLGGIITESVGASAMFGSEVIGSIGSKMMALVPTLATKFAIYVGFEAGGEGVNKAITGKGFEDDFWEKTLVKAGFMAAGDSVFETWSLAASGARNGGELAAEEVGKGAFNVVTKEAGKKAITAGQFFSTVGKAVPDVLKPSVGSFAANTLIYNDGKGFFGTIGHAFVSTYGNKVDLSAGQNPQGASKPLGVTFPNGQLLMGVVPQRVTRRIDSGSVNRASLLTKDRIDSRFTSFMSAPFNQCVRAAAY